MDAIKILEESKKHWEYMRDVDPTDKACYEPALNWESNCFLCESAEIGCSDCIMYNCWGVDKQVSSCGSNSSSVYWIWLYDKSKENCQGMIDALQRKIDSL